MPAKVPVPIGSTKKGAEKTPFRSNPSVANRDFSTPFTSSPTAMAHPQWLRINSNSARVNATAQMASGAKINEDRDLEQEADLMGDLALSAPTEQSVQNQAHIENSARNSHQKGAPIQMISIGKQPKEPNEYRKISTVKDTKPGNKGGLEFEPSTIKALTKNNKAHSVAQPLDLTNSDGQSDYSLNNLMGRKNASLIAPEVDHIVRKSDGGANSLSNARLLSKTENTDSSVDADRPRKDEIDTFAFERVKFEYVQNKSLFKIYQEEAIDEFGLTAIERFGGLKKVMAADNTEEKNGVKVYQGGNIPGDRAKSKGYDAKSKRERAKSKRERAKSKGDDAKFKADYEKLNDDYEKLNDDYAKLDDDDEKLNDDYAKLDDDDEKSNDDYAKLDDDDEKSNDDYAKLDDNDEKSNVTDSAPPAANAASKKTRYRDFDSDSDSIVKPQPKKKARGKNKK